MTFMYAAGAMALGSIAGGIISAGGAQDATVKVVKALKLYLLRILLRMRGIL